MRRGGTYWAAQSTGADEIALDDCLSPVGPDYSAALRIAAAGLPRNNLIAPSGGRSDRSIESLLLL